MTWTQLVSVAISLGASICWSFFDWHQRKLNQCKLPAMKMIPRQQWLQLGFLAHAYMYQNFESMKIHKIGSEWVIINSFMTYGHFPTEEAAKAALLALELLRC